MFGQNEGLKFRNYGIREGLSQSTVLSIFQDKKGFLWFGTSDGLNQFDGYKFKEYKNDYLNSNSLSDNSIGAIFEDSEDGLWIFTVDKTINKLNLRTHEITRFTPGKANPEKFAKFSLVYYIFEDKLKNIWISTNAGLIRYRRKLNQFNYFEKDPTCPTSLSENIVLNIFEDSNGTIWFATLQGLFAYHHQSDKFSRYTHQSGVSGSLLSDRVIKVFEDKLHNIWVLNSKGLSRFQSSGNLFTSYVFPHTAYFDIPGKYNASLIDRNGFIWVGTNKGLYRFDPKIGRYYFYEKGRLMRKSLSDNVITRLYEDKLRIIWVGTANGLNKYNPAYDNFENYYSNNGSVENNFISNILEDKNGDILTMGKAGVEKGTSLIYLNLATSKLEVQLSDKCNPNSIASTYVYQPFVDNTGNIWFCSFGDGLIQYIPRNNKFEHYTSKPGSPDFLGGNSVWGFAEDNSGNIYIPLYDQGLDIFNPTTRKFIHIKHEANNRNGLPPNSIFDIVRGKDGFFWISSAGGGVIRFDPQTRRFKQYLYHPANPKSLSSNIVIKIVPDPSGNLWVAHSGTGLDYFNPAVDTARHFRNNPNDKNSLANDNIWALLRDRHGNIWISCDGSIDRYNPTTKQFIHYKSKSTDSTGIISDKALTIFEDFKGNIWFGTSGGGLSLFNPKTNKFRHWTETEGLPNNVVYGILEDDEGCLWLSTNKGLSRFDVKTNSFRNYFESDGLQSNEFNMGSFFRSRDHKLYFGGINGFNSFYPGNIKQDTTTSRTVITGFQIFNKEIQVIQPDKRSFINKSDSAQIIRINDVIYLPQDIAYSKAITLTYREKVFTIEFAALSFASPERTNYRYKMENFDADWNVAGSRRFATYTNLPAGEYIFKVTAANSGGIWNPHPTILKIKILPPFWRTWWFLFCEALFIFGVIMLLMRIRVKSLKHAKEELEKKVYERTHEIKEKNEELELRNLQILKQKEEIAFQAQQLKTELTMQNQTSELALLRSQINPHFLFNTLNNIYSLVYQRSDHAPEAVMKLSEIMRYMLYEATSEKVLLQNEINYLKSFIELQLLRLKNKDFVSFNITGTTDNLTISPMLLIAFVENAFKHGVKRGNNPGIIINLDVLDNSINFEVINYCQKNDTSNKDQTGGIGLTNIKRRLELLYPNKFKLDILNTEETYHVKLQFEE
jgi:ligand-binding sensor domain-containing protein/sensor histidine kinase YesM